MREADGELSGTFLCTKPRQMRVECKIDAALTSHRLGQTLDVNAESEIQEMSL